MEQKDCENCRRAIQIFLLFRDVKKVAHRGSFEKQTIQGTLQLQIVNEQKERHYTGRNQVSILVIDDQPVVREGAIKLINQEPDFKVCAQAENADQALHAIEKHQVDLAVVDISLDGASGLELTERMKLHRPDLIVLILSMYDELFDAQRAFRAGAAGYASKCEASERIITAIRKVLRGETYISQSKVIRTMPDAASDDSDGVGSQGRASRGHN